MTIRTKHLTRRIKGESYNTPDQVPTIRKAFVASTSGSGATLKVNIYFIEAGSVIMNNVLVIATSVAGPPTTGDQVYVLNLPGALPLCLGKAY